MSKLHNIPSTSSINFKDARVFLRLDLNVPMRGTEIISDLKLHAALPSIEYICARGAQVLLATHLGRPNPHSDFDHDEGYTTRPLAKWFTHKGYDLAGPYRLQEALEALDRGEKLVMLENLRFFSGEKKNDPALAELLSHLGNVYVNDAFGVLHRAHTSVDALPRSYAPGQKALGLHIEQEFATFESLKKKIARPYLVIVGGTKPKTKLPLIEQLLSLPAEERPDTILLGGELAKPFLNLPTTLEDEENRLAGRILDLGDRHSVEIFVPNDHLVRDGKGTYRTIETEGIAPDMVIVDIGPRSSGAFVSFIKQADTIFANGPLGIYEEEPSATGTQAVFAAIAQSKAFSLIGGGDAIAALEKFELTAQISHVSTGGGAALAYLATSDVAELPAIGALLP